MPLRTCVVCGRVRAQGELCRLGLHEEQVVLDPRRRLPGRGAYVCLSEACALAMAADRVKLRRMPWPLAKDARQRMARALADLVRLAKDNVEIIADGQYAGL